MSRFKWFIPALGVLIGVTALWAQQQPGAQAQQPAPQGPSKDDKPRVYVTDSNSWLVSGGWGASGGTGGGAGRAGARPQTAEIIQTINERCANLLVTANRELADYVLLLDQEGGNDTIRRKNRIAVFNRDGDSAYSSSTLTLSGAVQGACEAIHNDPIPRHVHAVLRIVANPPGPEDEMGTVTFTSDPGGADILVDGKCMGNTPSKMKLSPGPHSIQMKGPQGQVWQRELEVLKGSDASLHAKLESKP
jgi:hypothetical protein